MEVIEVTVALSANKGGEWRAANINVVADWNSNSGKGEGRVANTTVVEFSRVNLTQGEGLGLVVDCLKVGIALAVTGCFVVELVSYFVSGVNRALDADKRVMHDC